MISNFGSQSEFESYDVGNFTDILYDSSEIKEISKDHSYRNCNSLSDIEADFIEEEPSLHFETLEDEFSVETSFFLTPRFQF